MVQLVRRVPDWINVLVFVMSTANSQLQVTVRDPLGVVLYEETKSKNFVIKFEAVE